MSYNLTKLVEGDNFNTDKYMPPPNDFDDIFRGMSEHGIGDAFTPPTWALLEDAHNKTMVENFIQMLCTMKKVAWLGEWYKNRRGRATTGTCQFLAESSGIGTICSEVKTDYPSYSNNWFTLRRRNYR